MESFSEEQIAKHFHAQVHVWNHIFSFIHSMSLKCAIELGILESIHNYGQPMPFSKLIASLSVHPSKNHCIYRLMRILTYAGFFTQQNVTENELEVSYVLTDASILLLKDNPFSARPYLLCMLDTILTKPWYQLPKWFKNDDATPFDTTYGMKLWDCIAREPKLNNSFNDAMSCDTSFSSKVVTEKFKDVFKGLKSLVDVGGGVGTMAKSIAKSFPLECIVYDLPHVVDGLHGNQNLKFVGGDMLQAIPPADAILMKQILHDRSDEQCVKILKNCKAAITSKGKKGKVIVIDIVMKNAMGDDESVETQLLMDMLMMLVSGKERNEKEWANLFSAAGFSDYKINPGLGLRSIIEVYP